MTRTAWIAGTAQRSARLIPEESHEDMMAGVAVEALSSAGLSLRDVGAVLATSGGGGVELAEYLGVTSRAADTTMVGGASSAVHIAHAAELVARGRADTVLVAHSGRNASNRKLGVPVAQGVWSEEFQVPFGVPAPVGLFAMTARRHSHLYGTTPEQRAAVTVASRLWAASNPEALRRDPLTVDEVLASPVVSDPLRLLDCCLVTDAAGAVVVTSADPGTSSVRVRIAGWGEAYQQIYHPASDDLTRTVAGLSTADALAMAGLVLDDVDVLQLYDAFTSQVIIMLEDIGFCAKGDGGPFAASGAIAPGGSLPMNTQGGAISYTHPGMFGIFTVIEGYRQLAGGYRGSGRQVDGAEVSLCHAMGYAGGLHASVVLTKEG